MKKNDLLVWTSANAFGLGIGFVASLQMIFLIDFGFDWEMHWNWVEGRRTVDNSDWSFVSVLIGPLLGMAIFGSMQALAVRSQNVRLLQWTLATVAGFGVLVVAIQWPLMAFGQWGDIPGPVEPIIVTVGGASLAGIFQYLMLRRHGIHASKWLILWIVGLVASLVPMAILFMSLDKLKMSISWPTEVFVMGFIVAGVAALISGKSLFATLSGSTQIANHP